MEPVIYKPKKSRSFWAQTLSVIAVFVVLILINWVFPPRQNGTYDVIARTLSGFIVLLLNYAGKPSKLTLDDHIEVTRLWMKPVRLEYSDFEFVLGDAICFRGYTLNTSDFANGDSLGQRFRSMVDRHELSQRLGTEQELAADRRRDAARKWLERGGVGLCLFFESAIRSFSDEPTTRLWLLAGQVALMVVLLAVVGRLEQVRSEVNA